MKEENGKFNHNSNNLQRKFQKFCKSNYREEINYHKFMRIPHTAAYFVGIFGYNIPLENVDFRTSEWTIIKLSVLIPSLNYTFVIICFIKELRRDLYEALTIIPILVSGALALVQGLRMQFLRTEVIDLYAVMHRSWGNELKIGVHDVVIKKAKKYLLVSKIYCLAIVLALIPWLLRPFHALFTYHFLGGSDKFMDIRVLPTEYPFAVDNSWKWLLCNIWDLYSTIFVFLTFIIIDTLFIQLCALTSLQVQIINNEYQGVVKLNDRKDNDCRLVNRLHALGRKHCQVLMLCRKIQHIYNPVLLMIMTSAGISLCTCVITVEKALSENNFVSAVTSLSHFLILLVQTVAYCNTTESLDDSLANIPRAIYESQWIGQSKKFQRMIILIILKSQRQFKLKSYGLYNVDREQLTKIVVVAINSLAVLRKIRTSKG